jgi:hypothetical protein
MSSCGVGLIPQESDATVRMAIVKIHERFRFIPCPLLELFEEYTLLAHEIPETNEQFYRHFILR